MSARADTSGLGVEPIPLSIAYWIFQVLFWGGYVAAGLLMTLPQTGPQAVVIGGYVLFFFYSIGLTHAARLWIRRRDWLTLSPGRAAIRVLVVILLLGCVFTSLIFIVQWIWLRTPPFGAPTSFYIAMWASTTGAAFLWVSIYVGAASMLRARRARQNAIQLELDSREAKLKALEAQIGPHFLFNCLNTLRGLIVENPTAAQDIVTRLANILRHNLARDAQPSERLAEQVEFTTDYLMLESLRFEERLRTTFDIAPETLEARVPAMLLQTLVENALKHGISHLPAGGAVRISTRSEPDGALIVAVENTGALRPSPRESTRVGLRNLRERMRVLHGPDASLTLTETPRGTVIAAARIPRSS